MPDDVEATATAVRRISHVAPESGAQDIDSLLKSSIIGGGTSGDAAGLPDPETLRNDVKRLQARLRNMDRMLLNPRSKLMQYW